MIDLNKLKAAAADAVAIAQAIIADPVAGKSDFAAALRSALDHANDLIALHAAWVAANPPPTAQSANEASPVVTNPPAA